MANPIVTFEMENGDIMKAELYPEIAPNTVNNFISLVQNGFYDGLIFHRVIVDHDPGRMPGGTGMGGPGYTIKGEFSQNGFANDLRHTEGVLSMARASIRIQQVLSSSLCTRIPRIWTELTLHLVRLQKEWIL